MIDRLAISLQCNEVKRISRDATSRVALVRDSIEAVANRHQPRAHWVDSTSRSCVTDIFTRLCERPVK